MLTPSLVPRVLFGKFRFDQRIGRGGMGVVFRATDLALDRQVAVKMLPGATPEYSELLRLEARAMAAVAHRHLAVVYGVEAWHGQPLLICEYMEHGTLADRLVHGPMAADDVLTLGVSLGEALDVIHARRLLHRDIKPSNIGFDRTDLPKLLDFGLAQLVSATQLPKDLRPEIRMAGTPLYMSPESVAGLPPTHAVDLWSLHVLLFEAMSGRHPFRGDSTERTLDAIATTPAPPLAATGGISADRTIRIASYFSKALSKNIAERPRSAADVVASLRSLMT
jgi:serine/threonine protein kinase